MSTFHADESMSGNETEKLKSFTPVLEILEEVKSVTDSENHLPSGESASKTASPASGNISAPQFSSPATLEDPKLISLVTHMESTFADQIQDLEDRHQEQIATHQEATEAKLEAIFHLLDAAGLSVENNEVQ